MAEFWCFNCQQLVGKDEVFNAAKHKNFLGKQLAAVQSAWASAKEVDACICQDCIFYRIQICSCCRKAAPLCMFTLEEWFIANPLHRRCLDCTALDETLHVSLSLPYKMPTNHFVQQCFKCSKFKYICSFVMFKHHYDEGCCHRAIRDGNESSPYNWGICIECQLSLDIQEYKVFLNERYQCRISMEPKLHFHHEYNTSDIKAKSYANAVTGGLAGNSLQNSEDFVYLKSQKPFNGPVFVISSLKDFISNPITLSLRRSLKYLEEKINLELKLCGMNAELWQGVLKHNIESTTQAFSLQGTETTDFSQPETRWAYTAVYSPVHASIVYDTMASFNHNNMASLMSLQDVGRRVEVCCFGAGLGSEVVGLRSFLPKETVFHLFDNCPSWEHNAKDVLGEELGLTFTFNAFDVTKKIHPSVLHKVARSSMFTFVKFLSAVQNLSDAVATLRSILDASPGGSSFLFIDNSMMSIKNFVESLVFSDRNYKETKHGKENNEFIVYTSYAEYRFEIEEALEKKPILCDYINLLVEWLDRPPLSDLRVYVFHVIKK